MVRDSYAAQALGLSLATLTTVKMQIAIRNALPAYGNEVILTLKATSLASSSAPLVKADRG